MLSVPAVYLLYLSWQDIVLKTIQAVLEFGEYGEAHPQPFQPWLNSALCVCDLCLQRARKAKNENKQNKANKKKKKEKRGEGMLFHKADRYCQVLSEFWWLLHVFFFPLALLFFLRRFGSSLRSV